MSPKQIVINLHANKPPHQFEYEELFAESRPPNSNRTTPEHSISLGGSKRALRIYMRDAQVMEGMAQLIRSEKLSSVQLDEDVLGIELVTHAVGWPLSEKSAAIVKHAPLDRIEAANVYVPLSDYTSSETPRPPGVTIIDPGPTKTRYTMRFDQVSKPYRSGSWVAVQNIIRELKFEWVKIFLTNAISAGRLRDRLARGGHNILTLNNVVTAIQLAPFAGVTTDPFRAFGLEAMPVTDATQLKERGAVKQRQHLWTIPNSDRCIDLLRA